MKNIYLIPTETKTRLVKVYLDAQKTKYSLHLDTEVNDNYKEYVNLYITSEEGIKSCWVLNTHTNEVYFLKDYYGTQPITKKIILATDQDLIKDGVQAISNKFLKWFIKNLSCEFVEIEKIYNDYGETDIFDLVCTGHSFKYKIIIPKEEPKQETLNLDKLESQLDNTLNKETKESLSEWLYTKRQRESLEAGEKFIGHYESCDLCHYNAFFRYLYNGEILYRCQGHKIVNINNLKSKFGFGNEEAKTNLEKLQFPELVEEHKQETLEEAAENWSLEKAIEFVLSKFRKEKSLTTKGIIDYNSILEVLKVGIECGHKFGIKWAQKQNNKLYSEEEVKSILMKTDRFLRADLDIWFEQYKKK